MPDETNIPLNEIIKRHEKLLKERTHLRMQLAGYDGAILVLEQLLAPEPKKTEDDN